MNNIRKKKETHNKEEAINQYKNNKEVINKEIRNK